MVGVRWVVVVWVCMVGGCSRGAVGGCGCAWWVGVVGVRYVGTCT